MIEVWVVAVPAARQPDAARWVGQPATAEMKAQLSRGKEGSFDAVSLDGRQTVSRCTSRRGAGGS